MYQEFGVNHMGESEQLHYWMPVLCAVDRYRVEKKVFIYIISISDMDIISKSEACAYTA